MTASGSSKCVAVHCSAALCPVNDWRSPVVQCILGAMAKKTRVVLTCDLHGDDTDAVTTVAISNHTARYELDVCQSHLDELTGPARRVRQRRNARAVASTNNGRGTKSVKKRARRRRPATNTTEVREWARSNGYSVGDRGRIPASILEAFTAR